MRIKKITAKKGGFCEWQYPIMKGYRMQCCDCGLIHKVEFKVIKIIKRFKNGTWAMKELKSKDYRIGLRMKR